jgi:predicted restriction endonuclease
MSLETIFNILKNEKIENITYEYIINLLNEYDNNKILYCLNYLFDFDIEFIDELKIANSIVRDDYEYKKYIKNKFKKCIICDNCPEYAYQVAHIYNFNNCKENPIDAYNINNGLLMCANTHLLFDKNIITINKFQPLQTSNEDVECIINIDELQSKEYFKYNNKKIYLNSEQINYLQKRYLHL